MLVFVKIQDSTLSMLPQRFPCTCARQGSTIPPARFLAEPAPAIERMK